MSQPSGYSSAYSSGAPPAPPGYGQYAQPGQTVASSNTVVVNQPGPTMVYGTQPFRQTPVTMTCPHCQAQITTSTRYKIGTLTWISCGGICLIGLGFPIVWLGCCLIPFCINSLKDVIHDCPSCHMEVGRMDRAR